MRSQGLCDALATGGRAVFGSLERRYRSDERGYAPNHRENESERNNHECENGQTHDDDEDGAGVYGVDSSVDAATIDNRGASAVDTTTPTRYDTTLHHVERQSFLLSKFLARFTAADTTTHRLLQFAVFSPFNAAYGTRHSCTFTPLTCSWLSRLRLHHTWQSVTHYHSRHNMITTEIRVTNNICPQIHCHLHQLCRRGNR